MSLLWVLVGLALYALLNRRWWRKLGATPTDTNTVLPMVSLLVPARNEAHNLPALLESLSKQNYPKLEIIVLDDSSTDGTLELAQGFARQDLRIVAAQGQTLPRGWLGKPHACDQLGRLAKGEILIFTDADTRWQPQAVRLMVEEMQARKFDALCAWPEQRCQDPLSWLLQPLQQWSLIAFLPLALVAWRAFPVAVAANGQCLVFKREIYRRIAGHAGVRSSVIEDMALARRVKRHGGRFGLFNAVGSIETRMYGSALEAWNGYAKNIYPAFGANPWAFSLVMLCNLVLFVGPWVWLLRAPGFGPLLAVACSLLARKLSDDANRYPRWLFLSHPLGILAWALLGLVSWWRWARGQVLWKGRTYDLREPGQSDVLEPEIAAALSEAK